MLTVHGQAVAGATFPVPIWHAYMAAALWHHKVLGFELPDTLPGLAFDRARQLRELRLHAVLHAVDARHDDRRDDDHRPAGADHASTREACDHRRGSRRRRPPSRRRRSP